jgi:hypothetical protein
VGQTAPSAFLKGGGIFQNVVLPPGQVEIKADIAARNTGAAIQGLGGAFKLIVDGVIVDAHSIVNITPITIQRSTLAAIVLFNTAGTHEVRLEITRNVPSSSSVPQFMDDVSVTASPIQVQAGGPYAWRENENGQLGDGTTTDRGTALAVVSAVQIIPGSLDQVGVVLEFTEIEVHFEIPRPQWQRSAEKGHFSGNFPKNLEEPAGVADN